MRNLTPKSPGAPRTAEWLARNTLLIGFLILLVLIGGVGYWSVDSFRRVEEDMAMIREPEGRRFQLIERIHEKAQELASTANTVLGYSDSKLLRFAASQKLKDLKADMDRLNAEVRSTNIADTDDWKDYEASYQAYWAALNSPDPVDWSAERGRMFAGISRLQDLIERQREQNDAKAMALSVAARKRISTATVAAFTVGLVIALLTLYEIRRILTRLGRAYTQISESRDYLQSLLDSLVSGVVVLDAHGRVQMVGESFREAVNLDPCNATGQSYNEFFAGNPALLDLAAKAIDGRTQNSRVSGRFELGPGTLFEVFASPVVIGDERRGAVLVFVDITEPTRTQAELRRNRALSAVGQMTAQIAHEIKNPLGSIRFAAELLKREPNGNGEHRAETIQAIERSVDHLGQIVAELSEFARPKELKRAAINLNQFLDDLLPMVADRLSEKSIEVERDYDAAVPVASFDGTELRKLFLNLIINAIDASVPGGRISLRTRLNGDREVFVQVVDQGAGMDDETLRRLFEPFYTTKERGTGLGMAIAKKIAELHQGDLAVRSTKGHGATATVRLPVISTVQTT